SFRVCTNNKVQDRNTKNQALRSTASLAPESWNYCGKTIVCKHTGKY
ncbi:hypothetical protein F441_15645, partial [Phytophthora nicotianae CJ01A1]